ncbi:putative pyridine nucleotide-disulfide oxidoreductase [Aspergillus clavatus NRRL 1]|uniref:Pyridine nucleotide-disulphide oxidoreductase, putative n=1 Tax=Aspergillus clavatus (strain ATCC 1007 / CBS 513.65 / DSM 816 / NCTC 3887 / NRRL 1 / QM 1276 / 107) TaxID=344612 RepID=A1C5Q7_ASPCL|nr:pyridine nucleotide-disulfide oxidoreductase, putative [Aspergillus clavatus NRRL 1]EAW15025.1 pyridine nucleotide-disulphide oxidoreductase, putative [Aspergillus clavatus NRRL 1]
MSAEDEKLRLVIIGGARGGMSAAVRARRLSENASIIVIERAPYISYTNSFVPHSWGSILETDTLIALQTPAAISARYNLEVRVCTELVSISRKRHSMTLRCLKTDTTYELPYDKVVLSQGADSPLPPVAGVDSANVFTLQTLADLQKIRSYVMKNDCREVIVLGGGFTGIKAVESLYGFGLRVTVIEAGDCLCPEFDPDFARMIQRELMKKGVHIYINSECQMIAKSDVTDVCYVELRDGSSLTADLVVVVTDSPEPRTWHAKNAGLDVRRGIVVNAFMQTSDPDIYAVGSVAEVINRISHLPQILSTSGPSNRQGRLAVDHIFKRATAYPGICGTRVYQLFHLTGAITGLSVSALKQIGYDPRSVTIHQPDHAGYYPSSQQLTLRIAFQPASGVLLGAQVIGRSGVESRINVLATALQATMTVFQLEDLELSHKPQYGSAKDPVNLSGSVASNLLRGDLHIVLPSSLAGQLHDWQIIDVRSSEHFEQGHLPFAQNIPIDSLRSRIGEIGKERPILLYSRVGYHGYLGYRILVQSGYQAANLDGGLKLFVDGGYQPELVTGTSR